MSDVLASYFSEFSNDGLIEGVISFYRRWFASETIYNAHALAEIGLDELP